MSHTPTHDPDEPEFASVPLEEQLDHDDDGSDNTDALDEATGDDTGDLGNYRDLWGPVWWGVEPERNKGEVY